MAPEESIEPGCIRHSTFDICQMARREYPKLNESKDRPLILISNDDGIDANGIAALASALDGLGELAIVAPEREQSAVGHAITVRNPVRAHPWPFEVPSGPIYARAVSGTPADCVKLGVQRLLPRFPDLVVSGVNQGPNTAVNVIYSGTVSAATEATILGIPAVAFSLCSWDPEEDFEAAGRYARIIAEQVLERGLAPGLLLNVNVPPGPFDGIRGIEITRQAKARWQEEFHERRDPTDRPYYWLGGEFINLDEGLDTDIAAIDKNYVSVTPLHFDLTAYQHMDEMSRWRWEGVPSASLKSALPESR
jgi:5'-nucleotidase